MATRAKMMRLRVMVSCTEGELAGVSVEATEALRGLYMSVIGRDWSAKEGGGPVEGPADDLKSAKGL